MDSNRVENEARKVRGSNKQPAGKIVAGHSREADGIAEKKAGSVQSAAGKAADNLRGEVRK